MGKEGGRCGIALACQADRPLSRRSRRPTACLSACLALRPVQGRAYLALKDKRTDGTGRDVPFTR